MKRSALLVGIALVAGGTALGHVAEPIYGYLENADRVYVCRVKSADEKRVDFEVEEVLAGHPVKALQLGAYAGSEKYRGGDEYLLVRVPYGFKGTVGWAIKGDCEWIPAVIHRSGNEGYAQDWTVKLGAGRPSAFGPMDTAPDGERGLSLTHVRTILKERGGEKK